MSIMREVRRERLEQLVLLPSGLGLEIGPLADPIFLVEEHDIRYVDVLDQAGLREHYREDPGVTCDDIPPMHYTLTTERGVVPLAEAVRREAPYRYVVACHVIEHVPDVIGWLADIAEVVVDDGLLLLVVPDKRCCFDFYRQQTSVGQMLLAADSRDATPSVRAVYDHFRDAASVSAADTWNGIPPQPLTAARLHTMDLAWAQVNSARGGHYVDCHVWTFTPHTFVEQISDLGLLSVTDFRIEALLPTPPNSLEFYAVLRRIPRGCDSEAKRKLVEIARGRAHDVLRSSPKPVDALDEEAVELRAQLRSRETRLNEVERDLAAVKSSRQWRLGGAVMKPLRMGRRAVHRLNGRAGMP